MNAPKYRPPLDPAVAIWAEDLDADAREYFEERAAIREFDGLQPRRQAEAEAKKAGLQVLGHEGWDGKAGERIVAALARA